MHSGTSKDKYLLCMKDKFHLRSEAGLLIIHLKSDPSTSRHRFAQHKEAIESGIKHSRLSYACTHEEEVGRLWVCAVLQTIPGAGAPHFNHHLFFTLDLASSISYITFSKRRDCPPPMN